MIGKRVYIETSVVSYLTARPTGNLLAAAWQATTVDWWESQRQRFELYTSEVTLEEAGRGDQSAAAKRLEALANIPCLRISSRVRELGKALIDEGAFPSTALDDALHVAVATVHRIDYLLTWNFRHLDNAEAKPTIRRIVGLHGLESPEICTPQELMGVDHG